MFAHCWANGPRICTTHDAVLRECEVAERKGCRTLGSVCVLADRHDGAHEYVRDDRTARKLRS